MTATVFKASSLISLFVFSSCSCHAWTVFFGHFVVQMTQLQIFIVDCCWSLSFLMTSRTVCSMTSVNGMRRLTISQMSISFMYDVLGNELETLMNRVVRTSSDVRFTVMMGVNWAGWNLIYRCQQVSRFIRVWIHGLPENNWWKMQQCRCKQLAGTLWGPDKLHIIIHQLCYGWQIKIMVDGQSNTPGRQRYSKCYKARRLKHS